MNLRILSAAYLLALGACHDQAPASPPEATVSPVPPQPAPARPPISRDPDVVLRAWGDAIEARDWTTVRAFWGDQGARSALSETDFAVRWSGLHYPKVTPGKGQSEGAAGSIYYIAPVTITDGKRLVTGEVAMRRVNDIEGATPEQLR